MNRLKINFQRRIFRIKRKWQLRRIEKRKNKAIIEANRMKAITGRRHYVLFIDGKYYVRNRWDRIILNKKFPRLAKINNIEFDRYVVYRTK